MVDEPVQGWSTSGYVSDPVCVMQSVLLAANCTVPSSANTNACFSKQQQGNNGNNGNNNGNNGKGQERRAHSERHNNDARVSARITCCLW